VKNELKNKKIRKQRKLKIKKKKEK